MKGLDILASEERLKKKLGRFGLEERRLQRGPAYSLPIGYGLL